MSSNPPRIFGRQQPAQDLDGGFTLVELLVMIVILGIVASIAVFAVIDAEPNTARAACQTTFKTVETAAEAYHAQTGQYPSQLAALTGQAVGVNGVLDGPWLKDLPNTYTPGTAPAITNNALYGLTVDPATNSIAVGTIKANGATSDTGTPMVDGDANCAEA
jgi:prepilin-type N-terminal cleavage/methylation domain-containing protein